MSEDIRDLLAREAAEAEARAEAEERGEVEPARGQRGRRPAADPSQVYAVRIPVSRLQELRQVADKLGVPPTALIRQWVIERLDFVRADTTDKGTSVALLGADSLKPGEIRLGPRRHHDTAPAVNSMRERRRA